MIHPNLYNQIEGDDHRFVVETREMYSDENSAAFALAVAREMNLPLVLFVDQENSVQFVANQIDKDYFFTAAGPINTLQVLAQQGERLLPVSVTPNYATSALSVTENEIEVAQQSVKRLTRIVSSKIYN